MYKFDVEHLEPQSIYPRNNSIKTWNYEKALRKPIMLLTLIKNLLSNYN